MRAHPLIWTPWELNSNHIVPKLADSLQVQDNGDQATKHNVHRNKTMCKASNAAIAYTFHIRSTLNPGGRSAFLALAIKDK